MTDSTAAGASATFTITRLLHAPRDVVWRAWTDEDELARWLYDFGRTPRESISFDVREGGSYRYTLISDNGEEYPTGGVFLEVVPPERLVFTWGNPGDSIDTASVVTITLTERDGRTELVFSLRGIAGHPGDGNVYDGWDQALDSLASAVVAR